MREILFRGKRCDNGEWVQGFLLKECNYATCSWNLAIEYKTDRFGKFAYDVAEFATETVGQFTGLTDKNGTKIFEGDVVRVCLDPEICIGDVIWDNEIASYNIPFNNGKCVLPLDIFIAKNKVGDKVWIEVIGNIHDNPELLEASDNANL